MSGKEGGGGDLSISRRPPPPPPRLGCPLANLPAPKPLHSTAALRLSCGLAALSSHFPSPEFPKQTAMQRNGQLPLSRQLSSPQMAV